MTVMSGTPENPRKSVGAKNVASMATGVSAPKHGKTLSTLPARGRCLVRKVETDESYAGSRIVLLEATRERIAAQQVEVLAVGPQVQCEDEWCERAHDIVNVESAKWVGEHPCTVKAGDWVLIAPRSLVEAESGTYFVRHDDILALIRVD